MTATWTKVRDFSDIIYEHSGTGIARVTINRPEVHNAFRPQTVSELIDAFRDIRDDSSIGVALLYLLATAAGNTAAFQRHYPLLLVANGLVALTLAVLDGMVVAAAEQTLIAPLPTIVESLTPQAADLHFVGGVDPVIRFRDRFLPLIDVALIMGFREQPMNPTDGVAVVVETESGQQAALLFDAIQGQRQVVIKSLETNYQQVEGVAAATILGDGRVALILDVDVIVTDMRRKSIRPDFKLAS